MIKAISRYVETTSGLTLHYLDWGGDGRQIMLLHGLASNARIWDLVAPRLAERCRVIALDQRGHGLSERAATYRFDEVAQDVEDVADFLCFDQPVIIGHSWGGNVALEYAATRPSPLGLVLVDGGILELQLDPALTWERTERDLAPPRLAGLARAELERQIRGWTEAYWSEAVQAAVLGNFEVQSDGTVQPHLRREDHLAILRALWEHRPSRRYARVTCPTLIIVAESPDQARGRAWAERRAQELEAAERGLARVEVRRYGDTVHDVPLHRPEWLAADIGAFVASLPAGTNGGSR